MTSLSAYQAPAVRCETEPTVQLGVTEVGIQSNYNVTA